jgi:nucleotide-binding universal stress UspA family protein
MPTAGPVAGPFSSVLCPVDFSDHCRTALGLGARLARSSGATLIMVYVNDPLLAAAAEANYDEQAMARQTDEELRAFLSSAVGPEPLPGSVRIELAEGTPAEQIVATAKRVGADVVVMSTQGVTGARTLFFGSTTEGVLKHARIPVLVVPPQR